MTRRMILVAAILKPIVGYLVSSLSDSTQHGIIESNASPSIEPWHGCLVHVTTGITVFKHGGFTSDLHVCFPKQSATGKTNMDFY